MRIDRFTQHDIEPFLAMALQAGWICDQWEFRFLLEAFPEGCFTARTESGPVAFITSVKYDESGWIGNLIVAEELRGRGLGTSLMHKAIASLEEAGAKSIWLTASADGKGVYEK